MTLFAKEDADRTLGALAAARDRIAAAMYTMDTHPTWARLGDGMVEGETERRRLAMRPEVDWLWAYFGALRDGLEQATTLRASRRPSDPGWAELAALLTGPAVGLDAQGMPVDSTGVPASHTSLAELAAQTEAHCAALLAQLSELDSSWATVTMEFARASGTIDATAALAVELGEPAEAAALRAAAAEVERIDLRDPLAAAPKGLLAGAARARITALADAATRIRERLADLVAARDDFPARRTALGTLLDQVDAAEVAVAQAQTRAAEKIANPGLGAVPTAATVLRGRLAELDTLRAASQWRRLADELTLLTTAATRARDRAIELRAAADGLLARRDELRGRLEAYRAKAVARKLAEDESLATLYVAAHDLLTTAPCDLRAATRAVHAYQNGLAHLLGTAERSPVDD